MQNGKTGARIWTSALTDIWGMAGLLFCKSVTLAMGSVFTYIDYFSNTTKNVKQLHI